MSVLTSLQVCYRSEAIDQSKSLPKEKKDVDTADEAEDTSKSQGSKSVGSNSNSGGSEINSIIASIV